VGDELTYTLTTTLPADLHFYNVSLTDELPEGVSYQEGSAQVQIAPADATGIPSFEAEPTVSGNTLTWIAKDESKDIDLADTERTITITFKATITPGVGNATSVTNNAAFAWDTKESDGERKTKNDDATTEIVDPVLAIAKDVKFGDDGNWRQQAEGNPDRTLNYQIVVTNTGEATSYHNEIVDSLPEGIVAPRDFTINGVPVDDTGATAVVDADDRTVTWTIPNRIVVGAESAYALGQTADFPDADQLTEVA